MSGALDKSRTLFAKLPVMVVAGVCSSIVSVYMLWKCAESIQLATTYDFLVAAAAFAAALFFMQPIIEIIRFRTGKAPQVRVVTLISSALSVVASLILVF